MKVLHLVGTLNAGGIERVVSQLAQVQKKSGQVEPVIACLLRKEGLFLDELIKQDILVLDCSYEGQSPWILSKKLITLIKQLDPDVIHSHVNFSLLWQGIPKRIFNLPMVYTQHSMSASAKRFTHRLISRMAYQVVSKRKFVHTAVSDFAAGYAAELYHADLQRIAVIYNGIDKERFKFDKATRTHIRSKYNIAPEEVVLGCVGRLDYVKGYDILINTFSRLVSRESLRSLRLMIVGEGSLQNDLVALSRKLKVENMIIWVGKTTQVSWYLSAMDLYVQTSRWETLSLTVLEALANGLQVVTSDSSGSIEINQYNQGIFSYHGLDSILIADVINPLLDKLPREVSSVLDLSDNFTLDFMAHRYLEIYESLQID